MYQFQTARSTPLPRRGGMSADAGEFFVGLVDRPYVIHLNFSIDKKKAGPSLCPAFFPKRFLRESHARFAIQGSRSGEFYCLGFLNGHFFHVKSSLSIWIMQLEIYDSFYILILQLLQYNVNYSLSNPYK